MFIAPILRLVCSMLLSMVLSTFATVTTWQHLVSSPLMVQSPPGISPSAEHFRSPTLLPLSRLATVKPSRPVNCLRRCDRFPKLTQTSQKARLVFILLSTHPSLPLHTPLVARSTSPPTPCCSPYISTTVIARLTSPHTQTSQKARLVFVLRSTHPSSLTLPLHTPRRAKEARLVSFLLSTQPDRPTWLIWHRHRPPYLSTQPSSLALPLHTHRRASLARLVFFLLSTQPSSLTLPLHTPRPWPDEPPWLVW